MEKTSQAITYGSAGATVFAGLNLNDWAIIVGIAVTVISLVANIAISIYFKRAHLKLAEEQFAEHVPGSGGDE